MADHGRETVTISIVLLTFNSEASLEATLTAACTLSQDVYAVDSFSTDATVSVLRKYGVNVVQRPFENYSAQRNWAIQHLPTKHGWQLHLDADEILSSELIEEIQCEMQGQGQPDGYFIPRKIRFLRRDLNHGGYYPIYHMRLFRCGHARVEDKIYDQHFVLSGRGKRLKFPFIDDHRMSLSEWTVRHNRWSDFEAEELQGREVIKRDPQLRGLVQSSMFGNVLERKRAQKSSYLRLPSLFRPFALFCYRYIFRLGFLDGTPGLIYCALQAFWFRFLIDAKCYEIGRFENRREEGMM
jgi:glycosyltransferase involved in cell wall biosynthesis